MNTAIPPGWGLRHGRERSIPSPIERLPARVYWSGRAPLSFS